MTTADGMIPFNRAEAERETAEARLMVTDLAAKLDRLHRYKAHIALGYATWAEYIVAEFKDEGIGVRHSYNLLSFYVLRAEIETQTGMELPVLKEKQLRGMGAAQAASIAADVNKAKAKGEDPSEAARASAAKNKPEPRKRGPRLPKGPSTDETTETTNEDEPTASTTTEALRADDVEDAPEYETAAQPVALPVKSTWTYDSWMTLTLACRDREGLQDMREHFATLADSVEFEIRTAEMAAEQRRSA